MTSSVVESEILTTAEVEARKRRERILQLKRKAHNKTENSVEEPKESLEEPPQKVSIVVEDEDSGADNDDSTQLVSRLTTKLEAESEELDLSKLASRKVDWDLKRGIEKSLAILLDRRNEVIAEIVQESAGSDEDVEN